MSGLMAPSVVFRTGLRGFMLTMLTWVNEVTVVFAQIGDDSVIEKATTQATEKVVEKVTEKTMSLAD
ncbi:MAG: hypothetical protein H0X47_01180 [Nitrospirales bacterium]|nr:hypothetical protein [Nitrospirales bacterium]